MIDNDKFLALSAKLRAKKVKNDHVFPLMRSAAKAIVTLVHSRNKLWLTVEGLTNRLAATSHDVRANFDRANAVEKKIEDLLVAAHGFDARLEEKTKLLDDQIGVNNALVEEVKRLQAPIPMIMFCPKCGGRHVDVGAFAERPHHSHACQHCGVVWAPAVVPTVGVAFLPGCRDVEQTKS